MTAMVMNFVIVIKQLVALKFHVAGLLIL